ncbi:MAG: PAS domain S-box protein [Candidatus Sericytochromatia bacterium]|nr:PAS domain S-box protein [Candidatus Sericytochromatia bacterium]
MNKIYILIFNEIGEQLDFLTKISEFEVFKFYDINQAINLATAKTKSIIIINHFSDKSIVEMIKKLKNIPIIFTSTNGNEDIISEALKIGAFTYLIRDLNNYYLKILPIVIKKSFEQIKNNSLETFIFDEHVSDAAKALQASEEKYKLLIENSPIGILFADTEGNIIDANSVLVKVLGSPSIEATKKINLLAFANLVDSGLSENFKRCFETGQTIISEILYNSRWDKFIYIRYHLTCIYNSQKNVIGVQALIEDITERKVSEIALKESEELYKTLARNLPGASVLLFDKNLTYKIAEGKALSLSDITEYNGVTKAFLPLEYLEAYYLGALKGQKFIFEKKIAQNIYLVHILPVKNQKDEIFAGMAVFQDITEQKKNDLQIKSSLKEKDLLLKEINHRVKNNLQIISSLLSLQSGYIKDEATLEAFRESQNRVRTMALIHEELYKTEKLSKIEFKKYVKNLVNHLYQSYVVSKSKIVFEIESIEAYLDIETAIPLGLIINELVSNSLKYAFKNEQNGQVNICLNKSDDIFELIVKDNGIGLAKDFNFRQTQSLGLQLIMSLTEQLEGTIELDDSIGTKFIIKFEELKYKERF